MRKKIEQSLWSTKSISSFDLQMILAPLHLETKPTSSKRSFKVNSSYISYFNIVNPSTKVT